MVSVKEKLTVLITTKKWSVGSKVLIDVDFGEPGNRKMEKGGSLIGGEIG